MGLANRRLSGRLPHGRTGEDVRFRRLDVRRRPPLVAGDFIYREQQGGELLLFPQRLGLGLCQLGLVGRSHRRPCVRTGARLRVHDIRRRRQEILPAKLAILVRSYTGADEPNLAKLCPSFSPIGHHAIHQCFEFRAVPRHEQMTQFVYHHIFKAFRRKQG